MNRTTALAAALAAGLTTFAISTGATHARDIRDAGASPIERPAKAETDRKTGDEAGKTRAKAEAKGGRRHVAELEKRRAGKKAPELVATARKETVRKGMTTTMTTTSSGRYGAIVSRYASAYGIPASLAHAVIRVESNYRADARGRAGEIGLMQIKPATARGMGFSGSVKALYNPETNIRYGMKYLAEAHKLGGGTTCGTILKYNAGHGARRMNPVSAAYCSKVKRHLAGS